MQQHQTENSVAQPEPMDDAANGGLNHVSQASTLEQQHQSTRARAMPALPPRTRSGGSKGAFKVQKSNSGLNGNEGQEAAKASGDNAASRASTSSTTGATGPRPSNSNSSSSSTEQGAAKPGSNAPAAVVSSSASSSATRTTAVRLQAGSGGGTVRAMPSLPARSGSNAAGKAAAGGGSGDAAAAVDVVDPEEPPSTQQLRLRVHAIRVALIRAARRLGFEHDNGLVKQVLYRLYLAEKLKEPFRKGSRRPDAALLAARHAAALEEQQGPDSPLDLNIKILVIGLKGTGKTQLIHSLLGMGSSSSSSSGSSGSGSSSSGVLEPFGGGTRRVQLHAGRFLGVGLTLIDTPGLTASAAGAAANASILRGIKAAFSKHQPDLVLYVDRFDVPHSFSSDTCVLGAITRVCGPSIWLNTIVALTHAGAAPPAGRGGPMSWELFSHDRMQQLQHSIREASGDARLMNPIAFAESHPQCPVNTQGQYVLPNGVAWQQHLCVLMVSAKLLADAEAAMHTHGNAAAGRGEHKRRATGPGPVLDPASMRQLMGRPEGPPVRYLMTQLTGFSQPLTYPDHAAIMELRSAQQRLSQLRGWRDRKELSRQIRFRLLQMRQMMRRQQRTSDLLCKATRAGGKMQLAQPRTATRVRPSVHPPVGHRYRTLEPAAGWIVRPQLEPHGMDNADNVEGFMAEKAGVVRLSSSSSSSSSGRKSKHTSSSEANSSSSNGSSSSSSSSRGGGEPDLLSGIPYRISSSMSAGKEQVLVQGRGELSLYHDLPGLATTSLSADVQTSGAAAAGASDMLVVVRLDSQRRGAPVAANNPAVGVLVARLCPGCAPHKGPLASGFRLQDCIRLTAPGGAPLECDVALGKMFCRSGLEPDDAWGANAELRTDARQLLGSRFSAPLSVSGSVMGHRAERMAAVSCAMQVQQGRRSRIGGKVQVNSRGVASLALQLRSDRPQWWGLAGLVPLLNLGWDALRCVLAQRQGPGAAGGEEDGDWDEQQQQQQQFMPELAQLLQQHQAAALHQPR